LGFSEPTHVQQEALPVLLSGRDCILHAQVMPLKSSLKGFHSASLLPRIHYFSLEYLIWLWHKLNFRCGVSYVAVMLVILSGVQGVWCDSESAE
jgi:hypothetical protein